MTKLLSFLLLLSISVGYSQELGINTTDATVTFGDLKATIYPKDSTANAFYIHENGFSRFEDGHDYNILNNYIAKIKILNKDGYSQADIEIRLYKNDSKKETLKDLKATTYYLENGKISFQKISPNQIYTEEKEDYDLVKFTFPALRPGAVVVYSYQKESPFKFKFKTWWFQDEIPKAYSRFETSIPGNYNYNIKLVGGLKLDSHTGDVIPNCLNLGPTVSSASCSHNVYIMKDIPAFIEESYLTSARNYISRLEYELIEFTHVDGFVEKFTREWSDVDKEIRTGKGLGRQLRRTSRVDEVLPENVRSMPNNLEKAKAIYQYVQNNYNWNGETGIYDDFNIKDILEEKTGNVSAINILLHNLYAEQGFKVLPVISSTRSNGTPTKLYPVLTEFNYFLVQLDLEGKKYLLDATGKHLDFGEIPFKALNGQGRLLDFENESSWIKLKPQHYSAISFRDSIEVGADGNSKVHSLETLSGYHALNGRKQLDKYSDDEIFSKMSSHQENVEVTDVNVINREKNSEKLEFNFLLDKKAPLTVGDKIYYNPFSFGFFDKNPLKLKERTYPIDFGYRDSYIYMVHLKLPDNMEILELPKQKLLRLPDNEGAIQFTAQKIDDKNVNILYRVTFSKAIYPAEYYPYLKKFFDEVLNLQNQSFIVLKKNP